MIRFRINKNMNNMKKIYISGPITDLDHKVAEANFKEAEEFLKENFDCEVVNPMVVVPFNKKWKWIDYILADLKILDTCDAIYMLRGWGASKGARIERNFAEENGIKEIYQSNHQKI